MTELEKCMAGEWYDCHDPVFLEFKSKTHRLLMKYNSLPYDHKEEKRQVLKEMLGSIGAKVSIGHSFPATTGATSTSGTTSPTIRAARSWTATGSPSAAMCSSLPMCRFTPLRTPLS